jgi:hypothetical protein
MAFPCFYWPQSARRLPARGLIRFTASIVSCGIDFGNTALVMDECAKQHDAAVGGSHDDWQSAGLGGPSRSDQEKIRCTGLCLPIVQCLKIVGAGVEHRHRHRPAGLRHAMDVPLLLLRRRRYSAACDDGERMLSTPSASVAEIVVRTIRRASCAGQGRPRCMVARLSHMTTSPLRHWCR